MASHARDGRPELRVSLHLVTDSDNEGSPRWNCFPDGTPPEAVIMGWRMLLGLPQPAQRNLWQLISAALEDAANPQSRQMLESYAQRFDANAMHVLGAVQACDFLIRQAVSLDLDLNALRADVEALSGGDGAGAELLLPRYESVKAQLRLQLLENTLADHGNVLVAFDWRVDRVQVSNHGQMNDVAVVFLNLKYRSGNEQKQLALQLPPAAVETLKAFWSQFATE